METSKVKYITLSILLFIIFFFAKCKRNSEQIEIPTNYLDSVFQYYSKSLENMNNYVLFQDNKESNKLRAFEAAVNIVNATDSLPSDINSASIYSFLSDYYEDRLFIFSKAIEFQNRALKIYRDLELDSLAYYSEAKLGRLHIWLGNYHTALERTQNAEKGARALDDNLTLRECALSYDQIYYYYYEEIDRAKYYNDRVASSASSREESYQQAKALNIQLRYLNNDRVVDSVVAKCTEICEDNNFESIKQNLYLNASMYYMSKRNLKKAKGFLDLTEPLCETFKDTGYFYVALSGYMLLKEDIPTAVKYLEESVRLLGKGELDSKMYDAYYNLQNLYALSGRYDRAYSALLEHNNLHTKLYDDRVVVNLSKLLYEAERESAQAQYDRKINGLRSVILTLVLLMGVVFLTFYIFIIRRRNREIQENLIKEKVQQELKLKDDIIQIKAMQQHQENLIIDNLVKQLSDLNTKVKAESTKSEIFAIIRQLGRSKDGSSWTDVENTLIDYNSHFYNQLISAHPDLTTNERRLCVLISKKMNTKQISEVTTQSINSINAARTRLRKKLNISGGEQSLISYLDSLTVS